MENKVLAPKKTRMVFAYLGLVIILLIIWIIVFLNKKENLVENIQPVVTTSMKANEPDKDKIFELDKKTEGTKKYYSDRLGIGFTYLVPLDDLKNELKITEEGNIISLNDQSIEVFIKNPKYTLEEAIKEVFLRNYDSKNCFVVVNKENEQGLSNYVSAEISFPPTTDKDAPWWQNADKCPKAYSKTNGIQYFLMNKDVPGKFMFIKIGQYSAASDGTKSDDNTIYNWTHSIRVLK